ncbi:MAG: SDR family NAD(P)-dependent oxidoreductase [Spirochaetota bacterium]
MALKDLIEISRLYGSDPDYVLAGGGNTSFKDRKTLFVKSSGIPLATIDESGFVALTREKLSVMSIRKYSANAALREDEIKRDLLAARVDPTSNLRPSVEASLHDLIEHPYIVHTHPHLVNALMCGKTGAAAVKKLFGDDAIYVPYTDPGYTLYMRVATEIKRRKSKTVPPMIFLENHGVFVGGESPAAVKRVYDAMIKKIRALTKKIPDTSRITPDPKVADMLPAVRMLLSENTVKVGAFLASGLASHFTKSAETFAKVSSAFTPDQIVYCKAYALYIDEDGTPEEIITACKAACASFKKKNGYAPKIVALKGIGIAAFEDNAASAEIALAVFEDAMKISAYAASFGGPRFMSQKAISFIDSWEVENYRRSISKGAHGASHLAQKIAVVTGGAQGFGGGIVEHLHADGVNVIIADLNEEKGRAYADVLNAAGGKNRVRFVKADVSDPASVEALVRDTVIAFGGLDVFISNAGILRAGSLDEMDARTFDIMTKVNYTGYFYSAKYASKVMKLQHAHKPGYFTDIIQINSKSGLAGSNKNFAYAGGKFGGIGLTQSFALELIGHGIKVNSICPGNFFDGPLWSDPKNGLFVQYLKAKKVPGAKTIADVKKFYEDKVPARRGCTVIDVMRAIRYVVEQEYETGQAVPVTGGQEMLK